MTLWRSLDGHLKKEREKHFFVRGGGAFMGAWLSGENGQAANVHKLVLLFFKRKVTFFKIYGAKVKIRFVFSYISKVVKIFSCARFLGKP